MISKLKINGSEHDIHAKIADTATKATQDDQGNNINDTYVKKTQSAGSALGLVKTGGDVSISSGVITVKDDSHNHIISNIDGLQQLLDNKADTFYIEGSGTTDATAKTSAWTGSHDGITSYYDGLTLRYKIGVAGQSTITLNINNLGAKTVYRVNSTKLTDYFPVNSIIQLIYHEDLNGGCWITNDYDANTNTQQRVYESSAKNIEYPLTARYNTTTGKEYYAEYGRYSNAVTLNPSTNTITATTFKGDLTGTAGKVKKSLKIGSKTFNGSADVEIKASDLGLSSAMLFLGTSSTAISDGSTTNPIVIDGTSTTVTSGNVVLYNDQEYVWTGSKWEHLGQDSSFKTIQNEVSSPEASGNATAFIDTITQNANGVITATKKNVQFPSLSGGSATANDSTVVGGVTVNGHAVTVNKKTLTAGTNVTITGGSDSITIAAKDTTYTFSANNPTLAWGTTSTIGTAGGTTYKVTMPANPNTDIKVKQTQSTTSNYRALLMGTSHNATPSELSAEETGQVYKNTSIVACPSTGEIVATTFTGDLDGNASTATKATKDGSGNVITSTYTAKTTYNAHKHSATYTPGGTVSKPTFTGSAVTSGKPDTTNVTTIYSITGVGTLPSATLSSGTLPSASLEKGTLPSLTFGAGDLPTLTASVENQCLTLSFGQGSLPSATLNKGSLPSLTFNAGAFPTLTFNAGSLPTRSNAISMPNTNHTHSVTASGSVSQPTFTGTQATITTGTPE